jgi:hypothetical protein
MGQHRKSRVGKRSGFRDRNHEIDVFLRAYRQDSARELSAAEDATKGEGATVALSLAAARPEKRMLVFEAVQKQLEHDNKRPFNLGQKLNDTPYRYTRDTLWAALNAISTTLEEATPQLLFPTEDDFIGEGEFSDFVNSCLTGTVSAMISAIVEASRWP